MSRLIAIDLNSANDHKNRLFSRFPFRWTASLVVLICIALTSYAWAQPNPEKGNKPSMSDNGIPSGIAWYGVLADGVAEAKATNRPIMLLSAAPQCAGVPGMW